MTFRYPCYRDFKSYAGSTSAIYELVEIAVREFVDSAGRAESQEAFISASAEKYKLHVHFKSCPDLVAKIISIHIVNIHEAFERFFSSLRQEAASLVNLQWKDYDKKDTLFVAVNNVFGSQQNGREVLDEMQVELCSYYRLIRNAAVHSDRDTEGLEDQFAKVKNYRRQVVQKYETLTAAPNPPKCLTRDDFQLFVRVAQDVAWAFSEKLKPTDEQLSAAVAVVVTSFKKRWKNNPKRVVTAAVSYVHKTYGISKEDAGRIVDMVH